MSCSSLTPRVKITLLFDGMSLEGSDIIQYICHSTMASACLELLDRCHGRKDDLRGSFVAFTFLAKVFCQMNECIPEVAKATRACVKGSRATM